METALSYASKRPINKHTRFRRKGKKEIEKYFVIEKIFENIIKSGMMIVIDRIFLPETCPCVK